jgi:tyrosyl-DNA phosphodiesterase 2
MAKRERLEAVAALIRRHEPDLVGLQELTPRTAQLLLSDPFVREHYAASDAGSGASVGGYGTLVLSRLPVAAQWTRELPTRMWRDLRSVEVAVNGETLLFSTVHLESLQSARTRREQLAEIAKEHASRGAPHRVLCGDFNFDSTRNYVEGFGELENKALGELLPEYVDVWPALRPREAGLTFDTESNPMLRGHRPERMRYDRIVLCSRPPARSDGGEGGGAGAAAAAAAAGRWVPEQIELLGTQPFGRHRETGVELVPSDHYGLLATLRFERPRV